MKQKIEKILFKNNEKEVVVFYDTIFDFDTRICIDAIFNKNNYNSYDIVFIHCPWKGEFSPKDFLYQKGNNENIFLFIRTENIEKLKKITFYLEDGKIVNLFKIFNNFSNKIYNDNKKFIDINLELQHFDLFITYNEMYILSFVKK